MPMPKPLSVDHFRRSIRQHVARYHASTPAWRIGLHVARTARKNWPQMTKRTLRACVRLAISEHHRNVALYQSVMRGNP